MPWATLWSLTLGHIRTAISSTNSCLGLLCGRVTLGKLLCDMSCIVHDNGSEKNHLHHIGT